MVKVQVTVNVPNVFIRRSEVDMVSSEGSIANARATSSIEELRQLRKEIDANRYPSFRKTLMAKLSKSKSSKSTKDEEGDKREIERPVELHCAKLCREFINSSTAHIDFISEMPYQLGTVKWTVFTFHCKSSFSEECCWRLGMLGIGVRGQGAGIISVVPLHLQRIASHPAPVPPKLLAPMAVSQEKRPSLGTEEDAESVSVPSSTSASNINTSNDRSESALHENEIEKEQEKEVNWEDDHAHVEDPDLHKVMDKEKIRLEKRTTFKQTVTSRVAVDNVVGLVAVQARFSFDYMMLVIVASILACIGLVTNNVVIIVASMLVSPLMGPILGVTFGWTLSDRRLIKAGLYSEVMGLTICCLVGFLGGLASAPVVGEDLPTQEMWARASLSAVFTGISIAIPSGVGVALGVLGDNTSSLVGVAISASLLPPAVNTGIFLAMTALYGSPYIDLANASTELDLDYEITIELVFHGAGYSLLLTIANIICIYIAGILMFKLKEVAPSTYNHEFWSKAIPTVRSMNSAMLKDGAKRGDPEIADAFEKIQLDKRKENPGTQPSPLDVTFFKPPGTPASPAEIV